MRDAVKVTDVPLKNLASPKPPSPALYFKRKNGKDAYISKKDLNPQEHVPHGRKFHLRRNDPAAVCGNNVFVHSNRLTSPDERAGI